jgi:hypothetical protein
MDLLLELRGCLIRVHRGCGMLTKITKKAQLKPKKFKALDFKEAA